MNKKQVMVSGGAAMIAGLSGAYAQDGAPLFKVGSVEVRPNATYSLVYDDNIFLEHKDKTAGTAGRPGRDHDFIHTFAPGVRLLSGDTSARQSAYVAVDYQARFLRFSNSSGSDAIDQTGDLQAGVTFNRLKLGLTQNLFRTSDADARNLAANGRVRRVTYDTGLSASYEVSEKTSAELVLNQSIADYAAPLVDSATRSATLWLDYQVLPKVKMGVGGGVGYMQVDGTALNHNPNSLYYNGLVRMDWKATEKVTIGGNVGFQHMNVQETGAHDPTGLIFGLSASWRAAERTTFALSASRQRRVSNALGAQQNEETSFAASLRQGLWDAFSFGLEGGYTLAHYEATTTGAAGFIRDDQYVFVKPSLSYKFMERAQASLYYQYRRNDANLAANANDFYNNQIGLELSYRF